MILSLMPVLLQAASPIPGWDDLPLYQNASRYFVGAQSFISFSSASAHGPAGTNVTGHIAPAPEALCNCACFALPDLVYGRQCCGGRVTVLTAIAQISKPLRSPLTPR